MNRKIILKSRPEKEPLKENFQIVEEDLEASSTWSSTIKVNLFVFRSLYERKNERRAELCEAGGTRNCNGGRSRFRGYRKS